jgi:hypothetical protein
MMRFGVALARPARTSATICSTVTPCAIGKDSVQPFELVASSSSKRTAVEPRAMRLPTRRRHRRGDVFVTEPVKWPLRSYSDVVPSLFLIAAPSKRPFLSVKLVELPRVTELPAKLRLRS